MQMKEIANRLEDAEMQMWALSSLLFVTNEAVKDKPGPEGDYAGVLCLASDMAKDLEEKLTNLREQSFELLHQPKESLERKFQVTAEEAQGNEKNL